MEMLIKAAVVAVVGAVLVLVVKKSVPDMALLLTLAVSVIIITATFGVIGQIKDFAETIAEAVGLSQDILMPVLKGVGIGIITKLAADISRDAGQGAVASSVELVGSVAAVYVALPLMKTVFNMIGALL